MDIEVPRRRMRRKYDGENVGGRHWCWGMGRINQSIYSAYI